MSTRAARWKNSPAIPLPAAVVGTLKFDDGDGVELVTARRVDRARNLLAEVCTREHAARAVGYTAGHAFRRALARQGAA